MLAVLLFKQRKYSLNVVDNNVSRYLHRAYVYIFLELIQKRGKFTVLDFATKQKYMK